MGRTICLIEELFESSLCLCSVARFYLYFYPFNFLVL